MKLKGRRQSKNVEDARMPSGAAPFLNPTSVNKSTHKNNRLKAPMSNKKAY